MKNGSRNGQSRNQRLMAPDDWHQPGQTAMFNWFRQSSKSAPRIVPRAVAFQAVVPEARPLSPAPLDAPADALAQLSLQAQRILLRMPTETRPLHCAKEHPWMLDRLLASWDSPATFAASHKASRERIPAAVNQLRKSLAAMQFLDPAPARMRDYAFPSDRTLQGDGRNLSAVLYNLWGADRDKVIEEQRGEQEPFRQQRQAILDFIQSLPEQNIAGLSFLEEPRGGVMLTLHETFGDQHRAYDASLLSDGTLRVLSIAAAMLSAEEGSLVVIEEIDNGVHPSRARHLLNNIREIAQRRNLRVLLSTHNPALLDALPDAALPDTLFCYRDPTQGDSRIIRLQDIPDYPELIAQDSLGGLATSGVLERFVKQPPAGERKERALAWLETLKQGAEP